jgi:pyruvate/2-oxoglutarate dehydrogenase complex dihydrolipoamide dehydrogenase (E3) component
MGFTEKRPARRATQIRIGKFPFAASGRALAAGESDGFVKLIFDSKHGELLGVHMIGENVTELLASWCWPASWRRRRRRSWRRCTRIRRCRRR